MRRPRPWATCCIAITLAGLMACASGPRAISEGERSAVAESDLVSMFDTQEPINGTLGFYEAIARAIKYNLDHRSKLMEQALADRRVEEARVDMLPRLVVTNDYYGRSNELASVSESVLTGDQSLEASTSSERYGHRSDLTLAWNVLDFGMSYIRSRQDADRAWIAREQRSKIVQDLMVDVRRAYWRSVAAESFVDDVDSLMQSVQQGLVDSELLVEERLLDPDAALSYERSLLETAQELRGMRRTLEISRVELAALVSLKPGSEFTLQAPDTGELPLVRLDVPVEELEHRGLGSRPELYEADYKERIGQMEVRRAMLSILPDYDIRVGRNADSNDFLVYDDWWSYSTILTKNLIELFTVRRAVRHAEAGREVAEARRLATSMAVLSQVHISHREFRSAEEALRLAGRTRKLERRSAEIAKDRFAEESASGLELIQHEARRLEADIHYHLTYADLQASYGRVLASVGVLPPIGDAESIDVAELGDRIRTAIEGWGELPSVATGAPGTPGTPPAAGVR